MVETLHPARPGTAIRRFGLVLAVAAAIGLTACAGSVQGFSVLDRDAQPSDALPESLDEADLDGAELESARLVGEHDDTGLWLLEATDRGVCLLAYADASSWVLGCGGESLGVSGLPDLGSFVVLADDAPAPEDATRISENVFITE